MSAVGLTLPSGGSFIPGGAPPTATVANIASICSVILYLSPVFDMYLIVNRRDSGTINPLPYFMLTFQAFMWTVYGYMLTDYSILRVNIIGTILGLLCCGVVCLYAKSRDRRERLIFGCGSFAAVGYVIVTCCLVTNLPLRQDLIGYSAIVVTLSMYLAPIYQSFHVIKFRTLEGFPVPLVICGFVSSLLWGEYSLLIESTPFLVVNSTCLILNGAQMLIVFWCTFQNFVEPAVKSNEAQPEKLRLSDMGTPSNHLKAQLIFKHNKFAELAPEVSHPPPFQQVSSFSPPAQQSWTSKFSFMKKPQFFPRNSKLHHAGNQYTDTYYDNLEVEVVDECDVGHRLTVSTASYGTVAES